MHHMKLAEMESIDMTDAHPFVFAPKRADDNLPSVIPEYDPNLVLASPFPKIFIEVDGEAITVSPSYEPIKLNILAIYCEEIAPNEYKIAILGEVVAEGIKKLVTSWCSPTIDTPVYQSMYSLVSMFIERVHQKKLGNIKGNGRIKYKVNGQKKIYKPSNVIYVGKVSRNSSKSMSTRTGQIARPISLTCVMGHWRKLVNPESIGLDRNGERNVKGMTFVKSYTRGDGEAQKKIYKVT